MSGHAASRLVCVPVGRDASTQSTRSFVVCSFYSDLLVTRRSLAPSRRQSNVPRSVQTLTGALTMNVTYVRWDARISSRRLFSASLSAQRDVSLSRLTNVAAYCGSFDSSHDSDIHTEPCQL